MRATDPRQQHKTSGQKCSIPIIIPRATDYDNKNPIYPQPPIMHPAIQPQINLAGGQLSPHIQTREGLNTININLSISLSPSSFGYIPNIGIGTTRFSPQSVFSPVSQGLLTPSQFGIAYPLERQFPTLPKVTQSTPPIRFQYLPQTLQQPHLFSSPLPATNNRNSETTQQLFYPSLKEKLNKQSQNFDRRQTLDVDPFFPGSSSNDLRSLTLKESAQNLEGNYDLQKSVSKSLNGSQRSRRIDARSSISSHQLKASRSKVAGLDYKPRQHQSINFQANNQQSKGTDKSQSYIHKIEIDQASEHNNLNKIVSGLHQQPNRENAFIAVDRKSSNESFSDSKVYEQVPLELQRPMSHHSVREIKENDLRLTEALETRHKSAIVAVNSHPNHDIQIRQENVNQMLREEDSQKSGNTIQKSSFQIVNASSGSKMLQNLWERAPSNQSIIASQNIGTASNNIFSNQFGSRQFGCPQSLQNSLVVAHQLASSQFLASSNPFIKKQKFRGLKACKVIDKLNQSHLSHQSYPISSDKNQYIKVDQVNKKSEQISLVIPTETITFKKLQKKLQKQSQISSAGKRSNQVVERLEDADGMQNQTDAILIKEYSTQAQLLTVNQTSAKNQKTQNSREGSFNKRNKIFNPLLNRSIVLSRRGIYNQEYQSAQKLGLRGVATQSNSVECAEAKLSQSVILGSFSINKEIVRVPASVAQKWRNVHSHERKPIFSNRK